MRRCCGPLLHGRVERLDKCGEQRKRFAHSEFFVLCPTVVGLQACSEQSIPDEPYLRSLGQACKCRMGMLFRRRWRSGGMAVDEEPMLSTFPEKLYRAGKVFAFRT